MGHDWQECRQAAVAGQFYPAEAKRLRTDLGQFLCGAREADPSIRALIVPHAGYQYSGPTAGRAFGLLKGVPGIERVVVIAPSHRVAFKGISLGNYGSFATPIGNLQVDTAACQTLAGASRLISTRQDAHAFEHALEVQLPFIQTVLPKAKLVPIVCGQLSRADIREVADALKAHLLDERTLWIISSDFTHFGHAFGYVPFQQDVPKRLEDLDLGAVQLIKRLDCAAFLDYVEQTGATICGRLPIALLLRILQTDAGRWQVDLVHYTTSGELTRDYEHTVSYASLAVRDKTAPTPSQRTDSSQMLSGKEKQTLLDLARKSIRAHLGLEPPPALPPQEHPPVLTGKAASFVSLHLGGKLRGCIGSLQAADPLYADVIRNACNAAFHDPRFPPLTPVEEPELEIEISVLTPPVPIPGPEEFEVGKHGIILTKGQFRSVFLPQVAPQQGWDRETTLSHLALKAGLRADDWRHGAEFQVFEAIIFS